MNKYKTYEELKEELGDKFEEYMYKSKEYINRDDICIDIRDNNLNFISTDELLKILKGTNQWKTY